jgi:ribosomal-protein-serine acetyltransferase
MHSYAGTVTTSRTVLPERLEGTDGFVLRRWVPADAPELSRAIDESADHLRPWMPWAADEPLPLEGRRAMIERWERDWAKGGDVVLGVFVDERIAGGCGLHHRLGPDGLEIGYWIHPAFVRRGLATRLTEMLTDAAFEVPGIIRVEIRHDQANHASAGIPRGLGFEFLGVQAREPVAPAETGMQWRWRMGKATWDARRTRGQPAR